MDYKHVLHLEELPSFKFSCFSVPRKGLGFVRHNPDYGSWNTDTVMVSSSSQQCDWKGPHRCCQRVWTTVSSEAPRHQVGHWIINITNSLHKYMARCPLRLTFKAELLNLHSILSFLFYVIYYYLCLIKFWFYYLFIYDYVLFPLRECKPLGDLQNHQIHISLLLSSAWIPYTSFLNLKKVPAIWDNFVLKKIDESP